MKSNCVMFLELRRGSGVWEAWFSLTTGLCSASWSKRVGLGARKDDASNRCVKRGFKQINGHTSENSSLKNGV